MSRNNEIQSFDTDPSELKPEVAVEMLDVKASIKNIKRDTDMIIDQLSELNMSKDVLKTSVIKPILDAEKMTLSGLYKQIHYHNYMIDSMMESAAAYGTVEPALFFQISELSIRATDLTQKFTLFLRTLPRYMQQLSVDLENVVIIEQEPDEINEYSDTVAEKGDEKLIGEIEATLAMINAEHDSILDEDPNAGLDFDPNQDIDTPEKPPA